VNEVSDAFFKVGNFKEYFFTQIIPNNFYKTKEGDCVTPMSHPRPSEKRNAM
jgi:hypothetical protein